MSPCAEGNLLSLLYNGIATSVDPRRSILKESEFANPRMVETDTKDTKVIDLYVVFTDLN